MFDKIIYFIKYNNAMFVVILVVFLLGTGVFASETGREVLGQKSTKVEGIDNTLLLSADLENFDMDFKIENIEEDDEFYYVVYTFLNLEKANDAWQYQLQEKVRKISKKSGVNVSDYIIDQFKKEYQDRIKYLTNEKEKAGLVGEEKKREVVEYSGIIGVTLSLAEGIIPNYEAKKVSILPTPQDYKYVRELRGEEIILGIDDSISQVYDNYIKENDPDSDGILTPDDNCPNDYNLDQSDRDGDGIGDVCDPYPDGGDSVEGGLATGTPVTTEEVDTQADSQDISESSTPSDESNQSEAPVVTDAEAQVDDAIINVQAEQEDETVIVIEE